MCAQSVFPPSNGGGGGLLSGTLSSIPATCTTGVSLYQATDQPISLQIYGCTSTNTWTRQAYQQGTTAGKPATCSVGQVYFSTDATAGQNWFFCTATNTWTQQLNSGGGGGASSLYQVTDFQLTKTSSSQWTVNAGISSSAPVISGNGSTSYVLTTVGTVTTSGTSNTNSALLFCLINGVIEFHHNTTTTFTGVGVTIVGSSTSCAGGRTLWNPTMTANVPDTMTEAMDKRGWMYYKPSPLSGICILVSQGDQDTINADTTCLVQKFFGTTAPGSVTGNLPGDQYTDTTGHANYYCGAPSGTAAPACTSVTTGGWTAFGGGGSSGTAPTVISTETDITNNATTAVVSGFSYTIAAGKLVAGKAITFTVSMENTNAGDIFYVAMNTGSAGKFNAMSSTAALGQANKTIVITCSVIGVSPGPSTQQASCNLGVPGLGDQRQTTNYTYSDAAALVITVVGATGSSNTIKFEQAIYTPVGW